MKAPTTIFSLSLLFAAPAFAASSAAEVRDSRPEAATTWWEMAPMETRSGLLRFVGDAALDADALPILVERLEQKDESTSVRMALAVQRLSELQWLLVGGAEVVEVGRPCRVMRKDRPFLLDQPAELVDS